MYTPMIDRTYKIGEPLLQVQNVSLQLGGKQILRNVNAVVYNVTRSAPITQGQVIGFLGLSGSGKTQLSKILAGLRQPTSGQVLVNNPPTPVRAGLVGYVTQNYLLRRNRTLMGNLLLAATSAGMTAAVAKEQAQKYVEMFELTPFVRQYPAQLSGGQRQRVAIAQQLLSSDHYLIMDEPFSGLDPLMKKKVCQRIIDVSLMDEWKTLIVISHDIPAVLEVSDTVWLLGKDADQPGSYIKKQYDLMQMGLCWDPELHKTTAFHQLVNEVEAEFHKL